jgi:predicted transglutaminase-like cysteine proteinase
MRIRFAAYQTAMLAAFLILLPGHIGAGEAETFALSKIRLAALVDIPERTPTAGAHGAEGSLKAKWRTARERMRHEQHLISLCRANPAACPSDAATLFMAIIDAARLREGRALLGEVNRAINLAVRPVSDEKRFGGDNWTSPLVTLSSGQGDCEDYAIAKLAALWASGIAEKDTRLVIVHDPRAREDHALAMVRLDGQWLALDNRRFTLIEAAHLTYQPLFAIGGDTVRAFADRASWSEIDDDGVAGMSARNETGASGASGAPILL